LSETPTEKYVSSEAMRSSPEWAASERMPRLPVLNPTAAFRLVITTAAKTEFPAAERFSERINSGEEMADPDMQELSPLRAQSAKQIAVMALAAAHLRIDRPMSSRWSARSAQEGPYETQAAGLLMRGVPVTAGTRATPSTA